MLEMTGSSSKIEGLLQVLRESGYTILEVSRTGRMAMRRGHHTSRVLKALGTPNGNSRNRYSRCADYRHHPQRVRRTLKLRHDYANENGSSTAKFVLFFIRNPRSSLLH